MANVGIIYSPNTGRIISIVVPPFDIDFSGHVAPGEALAVVTRAQFDTFGPDGAQVYINTLTGKVPSGDRYAMVNNSGYVQSVHLADPAIDVPHHNCAMIVSDEADIGWFHIGQQGFFDTRAAVQRHPARRGRWSRQAVVRNQ